jgi:alpha-1,2-rhamnosyltransferase
LAKKNRRLFIECTQTYYHGGNSGIQRVARNLANYGPKISSNEVKVYRIVWTGVGFFKPRRTIRERISFLLWFKNRLKYLFRSIRDHIPESLKESLVRVGRILLSPRQRQFLRELPILMMAMLSFHVKLLTGRFIFFRPGDIVILVDATWQSRLMLEALFKAQFDRGITLGCMIHDLFPLVMPETCQDKTIAVYSSWFNEIAGRMDFFVTNSESTRNSLQEYLCRHQEIRPYSFPSGSFRLGADPNLSAELGKNSGCLQALWGLPGRAILTIGTIEPRKNHAYLLDAYDLLRQKNVDISLIVVGRPGWKNREIMDRIRNHPDFGIRILHLDDASDQDLAAAIDRADCLVCPSLAEGFGLPLVEGLLQRLTIFASDIPVFRESVGGFCHFFDLESPASLAKILRVWHDGFHQNEMNSQEQIFTWPDWKESANEFVQLTLSLAGFNICD